MFGSVAQWSWVMDTYYTYILRSTYDGSLYIGYTHNLEERLWEHNTGSTRYTSRKRPWKLVYSEIFTTKQEAIRRERYLKNLKSKRFLEKLITSGR